MLEGPTSDARSIAVNEAIRKTVPAKPIRYVVNTHAHYDHAGGLRTYVAEGITVITHEGNKSFLEQAWARPRTVEPDALSKSPKPVMIETVGDKKVLTDGSRTVELYHFNNSGHNTATLIAYLPKERILTVRRRLQSAARRRSPRPDSRAGLRAAAAATTCSGSS